MSRIADNKKAEDRRVRRLYKKRTYRSDESDIADIKICSMGNCNCVECELVPVFSCKDNSHIRCTKLKEFESHKGGPWAGGRFTDLEKSVGIGLGDK